MTKKSSTKPIFISYNPKSEKFRECLLYIAGWYSSEGAELRVKPKKKGKIYSKDELELISKTMIGIASKYYKNDKAINYVNSKGQISHRNLEKILQMQESLKGAEAVEILEKEFKHQIRTLLPENGTLYCTLFINIYRLVPQQKSSVSLTPETASVEQS